MEKYSEKNKELNSGAIYTRVGDTNTPKNKTANLYDVEILWKRRLGLLYNPSQRAKFYLKDKENWELIEMGEEDSSCSNDVYYYQLDPDYKINIAFDKIKKNKIQMNDINDVKFLEDFFYLFTFINLTYHTGFSNNEKVVLYYKDVPLFSSSLEIVDEGRTCVVPPEFITNPYYIMNSFRY